MTEASARRKEYGAATAGEAQHSCKRAYQRRPPRGSFREVRMPVEYVGLVGTALGAGIAACVSLLLSRQNLKSEERQWTRGTRQNAYREFLSAGTSLHLACEQVAGSTEPDKARLMATPTVDFDGSYIVLQIVGDKPVLLAAREYNYWFPDLKRAALAGNGEEVKAIGMKLREARHSFLATVRDAVGGGTANLVLCAA
jgi:hypothetical protein